MNRFYPGRALAAIGTALLSLSSPTVLAQSVLTVGAAGGSEFSELEPAIAAAERGDTILIRSGDYSAEVTVRHSLALIADDDAVVNISGVLTVRDLPPGDVVTLRGLTVTGLGPLVLNRSTPLLAYDCQGEIWIEDCSFLSGLPYLASSYGAVVENCESLTLTTVALAANGGGGSAIQVQRSQLVAFDSVFSGSQSTSSVPAGTGLSGLDARIYLNACLVEGGSGSAGTFGSGCAFTTDGAPGLRLDGASSACVAVDTVFSGGDGFEGSGTCPASSAGPSAEVLAGSFNGNLASQLYQLTTPTVVREGDSFDYRLFGSPDDLVFLAFSLAPSSTWIPALKAPLLVNPLAGLLILPVGRLSASGDLVVPSRVPELGPGIDSILLYVQMLGLNDELGAVGGNGRVVAFLDRAL